jgi:hypothetical protein
MLATHDRASHRADTRTCPPIGICVKTRAAQDRALPRTVTRLPIELAIVSLQQVSLQQVSLQQVSLVQDSEGMVAWGDWITLILANGMRA